MFEVIDVHKRKGNGFDNLTGRRFGKLTVIGLSAKKSRQEILLGMPMRLWQ